MFNILIVEDDKELSQLFRKVLEKNGYQVKCASDGMLSTKAAVKIRYFMAASSELKIDKRIECACRQVQHTKHKQHHRPCKCNGFIFRL